MAKKKQTVNISSLIITIIAVVLAISAVILLVFFVSRTEEEAQPAETTPVETVYNPPSELLQSAELAAVDLLTNDCLAYQYFTQGMSYEQEPYGNKPEDGFYTCVNDKYSTFEQFSDFIKSIFTEETAEKLLNDPFGNGPVYADDNGNLGISSDFIDSSRIEDDGTSWENATYVVTLNSDTECDLEVTLKDKDGNDVKRQTKMILENDIWKLAEMVG